MRLRNALSPEEIHVEKYKALNSTKLKVLDRIMNAVKVVQGRSQASRREGSVDVG
jgi:hypothetical protein